MADYKSVIRSSCFTFFVGEERTRLTIHAGAVQNVSKPLYALIDNGWMRESNDGIATLPDVDEGAFIGFCEHAYTGSYVTPERQTTETQTQDSIVPANDKPTRPNPADFLSHEPDFWTSKSNKNKKSSARLRALEEPEPGPEHPNDVYPHERLWKKFRSLSFAGATASISKNPDLLFHAKLYVFATKYLMDSLRVQCLKSLHRDLCGFSLNKNNAPQILELLDFTYAKSTRAEPRLSDGARSLRQLVIHYVACEARTLFDEEGFRSLLDSNSEMGSDLAAQLIM